MSFIENIDKKYRYTIHSVLITVFIYFASIVFWNSPFLYRVFLGMTLLAISVYFVHFPYVKLSYFYDFLMVLVLPTYLFASVLLALKYYPNLSIFFKLAALLVSAFMFYIIALVDNIFLVVSDREETIPLYRAAVPWSQIILVILAIPLFAGIFKIPTYSFIQALILAVLGCIFNFYQFWTYRHEDNLVPIGVGGKALFSMLCGYLVFTLGIATSFMPAESFLRGLITAGGLMFGLFYTNSFLRNSINRKLLVQYFIIIVVFVVLALIF